MFYFLTNLPRPKISMETSKLAAPESGSTADRRSGPTRLRSWSAPALYGSLGVIGVLLWSYAEPLTGLARRWANEADYSHGFLVPVFAAYLLWNRREMLGTAAGYGSWWGLAFLFVAAGMRWFSNYFFYPLVDGPSLLPCLAGVALLAGGWPALRWAWPAIAYLAFMIPLPGFIAGLLSHPLQRVATIASTWLLQLFGVPAIPSLRFLMMAGGSCREGSVIELSKKCHTSYRLR
jgi:hypothetical protein